MRQETTIQCKAVMRGATDSCRSLWAPILPPLAIPPADDVDAASSPRPASGIAETRKK